MPILVAKASERKKQAKHFFVFEQVVNLATGEVQKADCSSTSFL